MTCYHPVKSLYNRVEHKLLFGRCLQDARFLEMDLSEFLKYKEVNIDCGKCIGCMLKYRSGWIVRLMSELYTKIFEEGNGKACFLTLTYDNEHLPYNGTLNHDDIKDFFKDLRKIYKRVFGLDNIKYLCCGEYGVNNDYSIYGDSLHGRPHYHIIILGLNFKEYFELMQLKNVLGVDKCLNRLDKYYPSSTILPYRDKYMVQTHGTTAWRSPFAESVWKRGIAVIGDVTASSCGYTAGYNVKQKMLVFKNLDEKKDYYTRNGERIKMPYIVASRNLGERFFHKYYKSVYNSGLTRIPLCDHTYPIPRIYNKWCEKYYPDFYTDYCLKREEYFKNPDIQKEFTSERLAVKEELKKISCSKLVRPLDADSGSFVMLANELTVDLSQLSSGSVNLV